MQQDDSKVDGKATGKARLTQYRKNAGRWQFYAVAHPTLSGPYRRYRICWALDDTSRSATKRATHRRFHGVWPGRLPWFGYVPTAGFEPVSGPETYVGGMAPEGEEI